MSLINDAIRQANKAHQSQPREVSTNASMEPVQPPPPSGGGAKLAFMLAAIILPLLGGAGWFLGQWWQYQKNAAKPLTQIPGHPSPHKSHLVEVNPDEPQPPPSEPLLPPPVEPVVETPKVEEAKPLAQTPVPPAPVKPTSKPRPKTPPPPDLNPDHAPVLIPQATTPGPPKAAPVTTNAPVVKLEPFPPLEVTFIFPSKSNPSANINGHIGLHVKDTVDGVTIVKIDKVGVTVDFQGRKKLITMANN